MGANASVEFGDVSVKDPFIPLLDICQYRFQKLIHVVLPASLPAASRIPDWFAAFAENRASGQADGLEFLSAAVLVSLRASAAEKIRLLFALFDMDGTDCIRKDEFTIFLKSSTTGIFRMINNVPPPPPVLKLEGLAHSFFETLKTTQLSRYDFLVWMTEACPSLQYLSALTRLQRAAFSWGSNDRLQLGLEMSPERQLLPSPVLALENVKISKIASSRSHTLFLSADGRVFSSGLGFCGVLGSGHTEDRPTPQLIEAFKNVHVVDIAVGERHSTAVSNKGQLFTWGSADFGQLGLADGRDNWGAASDVRRTGFDPCRGGTFTYVAVPTVVPPLWANRVKARRVACSAFTTCVLTDVGRLYSCGDATDGQAGLGRLHPALSVKQSDEALVRTTMQMTDAFHKCDVPEVPGSMGEPVELIELSAGKDHFVALDSHGRVWTWGLGQWGRLGHGDMRTCHEPTIVQSLRHHRTTQVSAGGTHSGALLSLFRLTVTSRTETPKFAPFSLLGVPVGRADCWSERTVRTSPPFTAIHVNAIAHAPLLVLSLPWREDPLEPGVLLLDERAFSHKEVERSVVLADRGLTEGSWLKLTTTTFDFCLCVSQKCGRVVSKTVLKGPLFLPVQDDRGSHEPSDCAGYLCVFECSKISQAREGDMTQLNKDMCRAAVTCAKNGGVAAFFALPEWRDERETFEVDPSKGGLLQDEIHILKTFPVGTLSFPHGQALRRHVELLISRRIAAATDGIPAEVSDWREANEDFTGRLYYHNISTGKKRWSPPPINPQSVAHVVVVRQDRTLQRIRRLIGCRPKAILLAQNSWQPDGELLNLPTAEDRERVGELAVVDPKSNSVFFDDEDLTSCPISLLTYEAAEELKALAQKALAGTDPNLAEKIREQTTRINTSNLKLDTIRSSEETEHDAVGGGLNSAANASASQAAKKVQAQMPEFTAVASVPGSLIYLCIELQPFGGVSLWGNATQGQLSLSKLEFESRCRWLENEMTDERTNFLALPTYISQHHEQQTIHLALGDKHSASCTQSGEVFCWGVAGSIGGPVDNVKRERPDGFGGKVSCVGVPVLVSHLESLFAARRVFCGSHQTFAVCDMPVKSIHRGREHE
uniref:Uncharacterized protein n=1 Tax=Chromera velia CCMP2878 TaxID=1169474 RepID=A0A0G4G662_9ALVE|eukprot:Cvel_20454.t1-p1 / transcript=Cvel_20454.t1 / gene=Cvel_20454 / organism=Chromera_velia_CCMP2878 / gene_product=E3 ubiquitin-protein ligase HERC2, putative / transcript_product=E3 ubiquitin-protein ligase HERC2, putative / location=Cvel_scaffold1835:19720-31138(-) / protein_length=1106 / sequence_SO=supercontig / SO=protein_coding / is_pseudo=false